MQPCFDCSSQAWKFEINENWTEATCQVCGKLVTFETPIRSCRSPKEGDPCKCEKGNLVVKPANLGAKSLRKKLKKAFHYTHTLRCLACHRLYLSDDFKVTHEDNDPVLSPLRELSGKSRLSL